MIQFDLISLLYFKKKAFMNSITPTLKFGKLFYTLKPVITLVVKISDIQI